MLEVCTGKEVEGRSVNDCMRGILDGNYQGVGWIKRLEELKGNKWWEAR